VALISDLFNLSSVIWSFVFCFCRYLSSVIRHLVFLRPPSSVALTSVFSVALTSEALTSLFFVALISDALISELCLLGPSSFSSLDTLPHLI